MSAFLQREHRQQTCGRNKVKRQMERVTSARHYPALITLSLLGWTRVWCDSIALLGESKPDCQDHPPFPYVCVCVCVCAITMLLRGETIRVSIRFTLLLFYFSLLSWVCIKRCQCLLFDYNGTCGIYRIYIFMFLEAFLYLNL